MREPETSAPGSPGLALSVALAVVLLAAGWCWAVVLPLPLTGEDWVLLARARAGAPVTPHLLRPLLEPLFRGMHAAFGVESAAPYHAVALLLHGANVLLVFSLGRALGLPRAAACLAAGVFAWGGAVTDALAWVAALNRPLATLGGLVALNGAARLGDGARRGPWLALALGFLVQLGANEEAYGTALLVLVLLAARRKSLPRGPCLAAALGILVLLALHGLVLQPEGSKAGQARLQLGAALSSFLARSGQVAAGLSLPPLAGALLPPLAALALAAARRTRAGLFLLGWWLASFVPFVLSDPQPYRAYPTAAASALLVAAGIFGALELAGLRRPRTRLGAGVLLLALAFVGASEPRIERLERLDDALAEIDACARELARRPGPDGVLPLLCNLEKTTYGLFAYRVGLQDIALLEPVPLGFLDTPTGFVRPRADRPGPWFGRRCEGSVGWIDPEDYFSDRPDLPSVALLENVVLAGSLAEAVALQRSNEVDVGRQVLVEPGPWSAELGRLVPGAGPPGTVRVLRPLTPSTGPELGASLEVEVESARPAVLALRDPELYNPLWRVAPDNALLLDLPGGTRGLVLAARDEAGAELPTFPVDVYGLGVLVPAGRRTLTLDVRLVPIAAAR